MSFDSDLLDDILPQPSNAPERALGKFLPKARRKNEKVVQQSSDSDHPAQGGKRVSTMRAPREIPLAEGCADLPRSPLCAKTADPSFNDCLQREQESPVEQTEIVLPGSDSLDDILPQLAAVTDRVMEKFQPKVQSSDSKLAPPSSNPTYTCRPLSSGPDHAHHAPSLPEDPISDVIKELQTDSQMSKGKDSRESDSFEPFGDGLLQASEASEAATASAIDGDPQTDQGPSGEEAADMVTSSDLRDDFLVQSDTVERAVGKFHPKLKSSRATEKAVEAKRCTFNIESLDDIFSQPDMAIDSEARVPDHSADSQADIRRLQGVEESELSEDILLRPMAPALNAASPDEHRTSDSHGINEDVLNHGGRHSSRHEIFGEGIDDHSQGILDGRGSNANDFGVTDNSQTFRQLRKRPSVGTLANELDDGSEESWELGDERSNDSQTVVDSSDDEYMGQRSHKKRTTRKPKRFQDEKEKPTRVRKKTSCGSDSSKQEPQKKKFSHSTQRSRRRVDKVLLETPEEDIDPTQLKIKDLIMLAEARERIATKEAATMRQSTQDKSDSSFRDNSSFANDNQEQGLDVDGDEANNTVHFSSTKLNYHTYMTRTRSDRWSKVDTELFYQAVRQFGTDFAMIQQLFPNRTRHQIKLKFKNEERKHPLQIADALFHRSEDNSQFELVIQRLQAQEEENSHGDAPDEARAESQTETAENQEEDSIKVDKKEEQEVDDWDQGGDPVNLDEYQDAFDWSQYDIPNPSSPYSMEKNEYDVF